ALTHLSLTVWGLGRSREGLELVAQATEILEGLPTGPELAHAYAARSIQEMLAWHGREAVLWGTRAIELAEEFRAPTALHLALNAVGSARLACFEELEGIESLERSARLAAVDGA